MGLLFLIEVARYVLGIKNRKLVTFLQYVTKRVSFCAQLVLCSIVMQNIQIYFMGFQSCLLILVSLHSETVEIFCLNPAILIAGRSCHLCFVYSKLDFFQDKHDILQQIDLMFIKQAKKKACIRPCDTNNFTQSLARIYLHTATESLYRLHGAKISWTPILAAHIKLPIFVFLFDCNARSPDHQFFYFFLHEVSHCKVRKVMDPSF